VAKPVQLRRLAAGDIDAALAYYLDDAGHRVAARFVDALERSSAYIARHPHTGSLRFAYDLDIPELRYGRLARFPYLIFYVERDDLVDVWRVLHTRRDVPATLTDPDAT
jgi:toxin ParE1/3/4